MELKLYDKVLLKNGYKADIVVIDPEVSKKTILVDIYKENGIEPVEEININDIEKVLVRR